MRKNKTHSQAKAQILIFACLLMLTSTSFYRYALEISVLYNLRSQIKIKHSPQCQTFRPFMTLFSQTRPFSATPLSLWLREQSLMVFHHSHQYFNILFSRCLSTMYFLLLPALHLGVMIKSFLFFKEALLLIVQACAQHIPYNWMKVGGMRRGAISFHIP